MNLSANSRNDMSDIKQQTPSRLLSTILTWTHKILDGLAVEGFYLVLCSSLTLHRALLVHLALGQCI